MEIRVKTGPDCSEEESGAFWELIWFEFVEIINSRYAQYNPLHYPVLYYNSPHNQFLKWHLYTTATGEGYELCNVK